MFLMTHKANKSFFILHLFFNQIYLFLSQIVVSFIRKSVEEYLPLHINNQKRKT